MLEACKAALPVDVAVCVAAVADWRVAAPEEQKMKKKSGEAPAALALVENPDILKTLAQAGPARPALVVGFAAETEAVVAHAEQKLERKGCDWILANDVSPASGTFGGKANQIHLIRKNQSPESWPAQAKTEVAARLAAEITAHFAGATGRLRTA
jgi:phosphopantothenoylcysteine decarboxylase/phosphopantothenate--cysteine ligase